LLLQPVGEGTKTPEAERVGAASEDVKAAENRGAASKFNGRGDMDLLLATVMTAITKSSSSSKETNE
jgi:hypothetical protein